MSKWAELDDDVLVEIARRITWSEDFIAFRCVCSSWQSAAVKENFRFQSIQTPWLMLPPRSCTIPDDGFCDFIPLSKGQIFRTMLPEIRSDRRHFWSKGDKTWTRIVGISYADVTYYKGKYYAIDANYIITAIDVTSDNPSMIQVTQIQQLSTFRWDYERLYILESAGALVVVVRKLENIDSQFRVFDIDVSNGTWTEVKDLGNKALFLGQYSSLSVEISHVSHCKANCLYFIQDRAERICLVIVLKSLHHGMENAMEDLQTKLAEVRAGSEVKAEVKSKIQKEMDRYTVMSNLTTAKSKKLAQFKTAFVRAKQILDFDHAEENPSLSFKEMINNLQLHEKSIVGLVKGFDTGGFEEDFLALEQELKDSEAKLYHCDFIETNLLMLRRKRLNLVLSEFVSIRGLIGVETMGMGTEICREFYESSIFVKSLQTEIEQKLNTAKIDELKALKAKYTLLGAYRSMIRNKFLLWRKFFADDMDEKSMKQNAFMAETKYQLCRKKHADCLQNVEQMQVIEKGLVEIIILHANIMPFGGKEFMDMQSELKDLQEKMAGLKMLVDKCDEDIAMKLNQLLEIFYEFKASQTTALGPYSAAEGKTSDDVFQYPLDFKFEKMILKLSSANAKHYEIQYSKLNDVTLTPEEKKQLEKHASFWGKSMHNTLTNIFKFFSTYLGTKEEYVRKDLNLVFQDYYKMRGGGI
ncbi:hypothetical protein Dsin_003616 [Dipteronia sinensis]|uniref:F-box domain-containing protein n=1 Tax=Dipteronia sinensis TaxID=43782 RepID=A0AAE0B9B7_9ROSI|nr:hypothetical protein Dsin_003616 [Dipteronia sinensis]